MTANVYMHNRETDKLLNLVNDIKPDILLTLETDEYWQQSLQCLETRYPYTVKQPQTNLYGMHLYSRYELVNPQIEFIVEHDVPSIHTGVKLPSGNTIMLHCLHPGTAQSNRKR